MSNLSQVHPLPWSVGHDRLCDEWHEKASPVVKDCNGVTVITPKQYVAHPGLQDKTAEEICQLIVQAANSHP